MQSTPYGRRLYFDPGCSIESAERTSTQVTRRANRKKHLTVHYIVEHPNQEGDTCIDWTAQYCWTNGWNCLWRGHSVYRNRPLIPPTYIQVISQVAGDLTLRRPPSIGEKWALIQMEMDQMPVPSVARSCIPSVLLSKQISCPQLQPSQSTGSGSTLVHLGLC